MDTTVATPGFQECIQEKIRELGFEDVDKATALASFVLLTLQQQRKNKKRKTKEESTTTATDQRCTAKRANGEQCSRRRKDGSEHCGTHNKSTPHGQIISAVDDVQQIELFTQKFRGIVYFIDSTGHVYCTEDVLENTQNPRIIATWVKDADGKYTIPEFGL
jgi:hypothetical protein